MSVHSGNAATNGLRGLLASSLAVAMVAGFLVVIVVPAFMLDHARDIGLYAQAVAVGLMARQSWAEARRQHRAIDRAQFMVFGGLAASDVGQLLSNRHHSSVVDAVFVYAGLALSCVGFGMMLVSYVRNRRTAKQRERRALMPRLTHALRLRSPH